jgi:hypothetical protein
MTRNPTHFEAIVGQGALLRREEATCSVETLSDLESLQASARINDRIACTLRRRSE